ncbi:MAG: CDP-glycerol glycerophosphotransferase family protein [Peptostreptococcaceae bacterium]
MKLEIKNIFHKLFAVFFNLYRIFPIKDNRYTFIMTHDSSEYGNVGCMKKYILERENIDYVDITKEDYVISVNNIHRLIKLFFYKSYYMATSKCILLDNAFLPLAYCNMNKNTKVIQLWHGSNAIKRFGQTVNTGLLKELEKKLANKYTYLVLNSESTREKYKEAFGVTDDQILITGCPRLDIFFDEDVKGKIINSFYIKNKNLIDKKIILYAPTFRTDKNNFIGKIIDVVDKNTIIMLKLHPFVKDHVDIDDKHKDRIIIISDLIESILVSNMLITDYSSIIYDYSILNKPMLFFCYDYEEYMLNDRGFYEEYKTYVPGRICFCVNDLRDTILNIDKINYDEYVRHLNRYNNRFIDGMNRKRLFNFINKG